MRGLAGFIEHIPPVAQGQPMVIAGRRRPIGQRCPIGLHMTGSDAGRFGLVHLQLAELQEGLNPPGLQASVGFAALASIGP